MGTKDGLTAWEVIWLLFPESEYGSNQSALALWPGGVAWIDDKYYNKNSGEIVWPGSVMLLFLDLLREGLWYATGRLVPVDPSKGRERLQPDLWNILGIDLDNNTASGGGLEYTGLQFFEKRKVGKFLSREPVSRTDLKLFMKKRIADLKKGGERSSAREDETAARKHFKDRSINRGWIKDLRHEFDVPENWSTRGRRN